MNGTETIDLTKGGVAMVIVGEGMDIPDPYNFHKQVLSLAGNSLPADPMGISTRIPSNTKLVIIAGKIEQHIFGAFRQAMSQRKMVFLQRDNLQALKQSLNDCFPGKTTPNNGHGIPSVENTERKQAPKGSIKDFIEKHAKLTDPTVSNAEEARRLFKIAQTEIPTR